MREYLPLLIVCAVIGVFTILFLAAYAVLKRKTKEETSERHMSDSEIIKRLLGYARPYKKDFVLVFLIMLVSIAYDVVSPLLVADIQGTIKQSFELSRLYSLVAVYAGILAVSMVCTYFQAMILQKTGQKILSQIRLDTFTHIEQLSHAQLNQIPVGKLVTRVTNDPNSISYLFTNILVTLAKNSLVIIGVLAAMLILNYALTLMVLCFVPFLVIFTIIFQKFSRHVHRTVNNARTDVNTYLSENLSGMKVTQIFNQEQRKMDEFLARSKRPWEDQDEPDVRLRHLPAHGIHAVRHIQPVPLLYRLQGLYQGHDLSGANHYQRDGGRFLYVYLPVLQPHSGAGRAV